MNIILKYFPDLTKSQIDKFERLNDLYRSWNEKINVISRKDIDNLYERHILHSLAIAKVIQFEKGTKIMDVGTGGGFPGIPLAILFPDAKFFLIDSIAKKIKVVNEIASELKLENVIAKQTRVEDVNDKFDFITARAVTTIPVFLSWIKNKISSSNKNKLQNGILYIKGGDISSEINDLEKGIKIFYLKDFFEEEFFETKSIIYIK